MHANMATEKKTPGLAEKTSEIHASVLHGAKDLRIVGTPRQQPQDLGGFVEGGDWENWETRRNKLTSHALGQNNRKHAPSPRQALQSFKSASVALVSAARTCITTATSATATSLCKSPCRWATSRRVWW